MEIKIEADKLRERSIFLAVPMYGGACTGTFARSVADLTALCTHYGVQIRLYFLFNESLVQRGRNYCADEFMRSGDSHLLFIDSDIGFNARDVIAMLALQSQNPDDDQYDILCAPYPKKTISWEKVRDAVNKGIGDEDPNELEKFVGDYVFNPAPGQHKISLGEPAEVLESGTGFMMIRRNTFERFMESYPYQSYKPDHVRSEHFDGSREIFAFFDTPIDGKRAYIEKEIAWFLNKNPKATHKEIIDFVNDPNYTSVDYSKRYLSEDYMFCQWVRNIGLKIWLCPWIQLQHVGTMVYGGSLADMARIGAAATVDMSKIKKK